MKPNILIVEAGSRRLEAINACIKASRIDCNVFRYYETIVEKEGKKQIKDVFERLDIQGRWIHPESAMKDYKFILRLRHFGDCARRGLPDADLKVGYGGKGFNDSRLQADEKPFYMPFGDTQAGNIKPEDIQELLAYALGNSEKYPACLLPPAYDAALEIQLKREHEEARFFAGESAKLKPFTDQAAKVAVLWNKVPVSENAANKPLLAGLFPKLFNTTLPIEKIDLITSKEAFEKIDQEEINRYDALLLCLELAWYNEKLTGFEGIDILTHLRQKGFRGLVFITSFAPWEVFEKHIKSGEFRYKILQTPYTFFINLKDGTMPDQVRSDYENLSSVRLTDTGLRDIQYYIIDRAGNLHGEFHSFKGQIKRAREQGETPSALRERMQSFFDERLTPLVALSKRSELIHMRNEILEAMDKKTDLHPYHQLLYPNFNKIEKLLPVQSKSNTYSDKVDNWALLFVDDRVEERQRMEKIAKNNGLICLTAGSGQEAIKLLKKDSAGLLAESNGKINFITVLISDFRFLHPDGHWQQMQGYDIIDDVSNRLPNFLSYAILTDKQGAILREVRRPSKTRVVWFSKNLTSTTQSASVLAEEIRELGQETWNALSVQNGSTEAWNDGVKDRTVPLRDWYRYYRTLENYKFYEERINQVARWYIEFYRRTKEKEAQIKNDRLFDSKLIDEEISRLTKRIKSKNSNPCIPLQFTARLTASPYQNDQDYSGNLTSLTREKKTFGDIFTFLNRLLGRRVTLFLVHKEKESDISAIADLLTFKPDNSSNLNVHLFASYLALASSADLILELPLLVEEQNFLHSY